MRAISQIFVMISGLAVLAMGIAGCSSSAAEPCETTDDCFQGEYCDQDGFCAANTDPGNGGGNDVNGGGNDANGGGNDANGEVVCAPEDVCDRGVDSDVIAPSHLNFRPEDDEAEHYGCYEGGEERRFVGVDERAVNAKTCRDSEHRYRIRAGSCSQIDFFIDIHLKPESDLCPVQDFVNVAFIVDGGNYSECESSTDSQCWEEREPDDHDGLRWTVWYTDTFQSDDDTYIDVLISPDDGVSVPYELVVSVVET